MTSTEARQRIAGRWLVFLATCFWGTTATLARSVFRDDGVPALTLAFDPDGMIERHGLGIAAAGDPAAFADAAREAGLEF